MKTNKLYDRELIMAMSEVESALLYAQSVLESRYDEPNTATNEPNYKELTMVLDRTYANMCMIRPYVNSIINVSLLSDFSVEEVS